MLTYAVMSAYSVCNRRRPFQRHDDRVALPEFCFTRLIGLAGIRHQVRQMDTAGAASLTPGIWQ